MDKRIDLTSGPVTGQLVKLAIPIMGVAFIQTAYNLIDMLWIGRLGSLAVAAVGTAGFFTWMAEAFMMLTKLGVSIKVSQSIGQKDLMKTKQYIISALQMNLLLSVLYGIFLVVCHKPLIGFFALEDLSVIEMASTYLITVGAGMVFFFSGPVFTGIFTGLGDSKTPFVINTIGLVANIILDPILIFGIAGVPAMGVFGAALATVLAQAIVTGCFMIVLLKRRLEYFSLNICKMPHWQSIKEIVYIGLPGALQSGLFTVFSMVIGRIIAYWGPIAIAAQKVGVQIEAISWLTAGGFSTAIATYVGQNYGAGKYERIHKGVRATLGLAMGLGVITSLILILGREPLMRIFVSEPETIAVGMQYLLILGYSQLFMCIEITMSGAFSGMGRTYLPNTISVILTGARIPLALVLGKQMGIDGIWWSISITSIIKGIVLWVVYYRLKARGQLMTTPLASSVEGTC